MQGEPGVKIMTHIIMGTSGGAVLQRSMGMKMKASIQALTFSGQIVDPKGEMNLKKKKEIHRQMV